MADTVEVEKIYGANSAEAGRGRYVYRLSNKSDSTGENAVTKIDISSLFAPGPGKTKLTPTYTVVERIDYRVTGFDYVELLWDHDTDDQIAVLREQGVIDFTPFGGQIDPKSAGGTGDIKLTTAGATTGGSYEIAIQFRVKA